ncbi:MAG: S8 family serine peptidase, partial [Planctomycetes bacterium]|nr:S8 family serine peptidase [Planctomycetota bacterium]
DTGVDYTHPRLGGGEFPNDKVIGGYDTAEDDGDPMGVGSAHGTACAGIAAGDLGTVGDYIGGVAPGAKLYALKATPDDGASFPSDATLAAWDWCLTHRNDDPENPILVMSNSWAIWGLPFDSSADADAFSPALTQAAANAVAAGITILAGSGNDGFSGQGITWPAAMSDVISVGAVYDTTDEVTDYSNTAEILDILAPADPMYTTDIVAEGGYDPGDYYPNFNGTSSACPFAAGVVASLQHAAKTKMGTYLSHKKIREVLVATGDPVTDSKVDITKPRVNLGEALGGLSFGAPLYIEDGCVVNGEVFYDFEPNSFVWGPETFNIEMDPLFIGDHFLNQVAAGQLVDSPCVDAGNDLAANIGLGAYTTRTDSVVDVNTVDMGYHHAQFPVLQYHLNVMVTNVEGASAIEYTLDPDNAEYNQYTVVKVSVTPPPGYGDDASQQFQVRWSGTDNDMATGPENYVTMDVDKTVHVTYTPRYYLTYDFDPVAELPGFSPVLTPPSGYKDKDSIVELSVGVVPDPNLYQILWTGTDDDTSTLPFNTVAMDSDKHVKVTFQLKETRYYAVVCGIADYLFDADIRWSVNDAEQFYRKLRQSANWNPQALDNPDNIILLTDSGATKSGIQAAIMEMADRADDDDVFVFYFAGHGTTATDLEPTDERDSLDEYLVTYAGQNISDDEMSQWLSSVNLPTRDYLVILDTSFYGANSDLVLSPRGIGGVAPDMGDGFAEDLVRVPVETPDAEVGIVLSACSADQLAWENVTLRHGVFTNYLLESMDKDSGADLFAPAGWISTREAYGYAKDNVNDWMVQNADKFEDLIGLQVSVQQTVQIKDTGHDGPIDFFDLAEIILQQRTLSVPADYPTLQSAVEGARPGDVIILSSGFYDGTGLVIDKEVTITGTNPDDADIVAAMVIYVGGFAGSGIRFATTAGSKTVLN